MSLGHILVIDDEPDIRELVQEILRDEGYEVSVANDAAQARDARRSCRPDLVLLDIWMPGEDGISLLREWADTGLLNCPVVVMSGHGTIETAIEATRLGAKGFIEKPLALGKLIATVRRTLADTQAGQPGPPSASSPNIVGSHPLINSLRETLKRLAQHETTVLLIGEPGTGKETAARFLHARREPLGTPFIAFDPIPLSPENTAATLFGSLESEQGGLLEQVHGGTLFLEEIADIDRQTLAHLLNRMSRRNLEPPRRASVRPSSTRLVCATRYDLRPGGASGGLFQELYARLEAIPVVVPPLRDYAEDIPELLAYFVDFYCERERCSYRHFSIAAQNRLRQHSWPGNLAELRQVVKRVLLTGMGDEVSLQEVEQSLSESEFAGQACAPTDKLMELPLREAREAFERGYLLHQLQRAEGSVSKLAQRVGMERTHLYRKLRALKIDLKDAN